MLSRAALVLVTVFWVTMSVLLWRAEFGSRESGGAVPAELVWEKMLTAPDNSSLTILHRGGKVGFCMWVTSVGEEWASLDDENIPAGVPKFRNYRIWLEGNALVGDLTNRLDFEGTLKLDGNRDWAEIRLKCSVRPMSIEVHSTAAEESIRLTASDGGTRFGRVFRFSDFRNPAGLAGEWLGPEASAFLAEMDFPAQASTGEAVSLGLKWEAREDTLRLGHTPVRVYRLRTRVLDRYEATVFVSRVGEILRVELPGDLVLVNEPTFRM